MDADGGLISDQESGLAWQIGVWDRISHVYWDEVDSRFAPVVDGVLHRADLRPGEHVLDLGTGTGAVAARAAATVASGGGSVLALDISPEMLALAEQRAQRDDVQYMVKEGSAEAPQPFLNQLAACGMDARVEVDVLGFSFPNFTLAWDVLAGVTTAQLSPERREEAQAAVWAAMWPEPDQPRRFHNRTQFIVGTRR